MPKAPLMFSIDFIFIFAVQFVLSSPLVSKMRSKIAKQNTGETQKHPVQPTFLRLGLSLSLLTETGGSDVC